MFYLQLVKKKWDKPTFFLNYIDNYDIVTVNAELSKGVVV